MWQLTAAPESNGSINQDNHGALNQVDDHAAAVASVVLTTIPSSSHQQQQPQYQLQLSSGHVLAYHPPGVPNARQPALWRLKYPNYLIDDECINEVDDSDIIVAFDVVQDQYNKARELASILTKDDEESHAIRSQTISLMRPLYDSNICRLYEHVQQAWHHLWIHQYLPKCIVLSALEEGLYQVLQHYQQQQQQQQAVVSEATATPAIATTSTSSIQHQLQQTPRYYATYPTQYLIPPRHPNDVSAVTSTTNTSGGTSQQQPMVEVSISSSALLSRIKQALSLAAAASNAVAPTSSTAASLTEPAGTASAATPTPTASTEDEAMAAAMSASLTDATLAVRRSRRATTPSLAAVASSEKLPSQQSQQPLVVQKGGRIAMWLLQQMEHELRQQSTTTLENFKGDSKPESSELIQNGKLEETEVEKGEEENQPKKEGGEENTEQDENPHGSEKKNPKQIIHNDDEEDVPSEGDNDIETDDNPKDDDYKSEKEADDDDDDDNVLQDVVREDKEDLADVVIVPQSNKGKRGKKRGRPAKPKLLVASSDKHKKGKHSIPEENGDAGEEEEEVQMTDIDIHLEDDDLVFANPYFVQPKLRDVVEWLGRGQRGGKPLLSAMVAAAELPLTMTHVQEAMAKCCWRAEPIKQQKGKTKRNTVLLPTAALLAESRGSKNLVGLTQSDLISVDQVVLKESSGFRTGSEDDGQNDDQLVVLECRSPLDVRPKDIPKLDCAVFAKSKFALHVVDTTDRSPEQLEEWRLEQIQEWQSAEQAFKKTKNWATWRYKGIHDGYTFWPSWEEAALEWCLSHNAKEPLGAADASAPSLISHSVTETSVPLSINSPVVGGPVKASTDVDHTSSPVPSHELADLALAQSLAAAAEDQNLGAISSGGIRRTARRNAATGTGESGIFYGSQSSMTQKQLMDTVLRLVQIKSFQTLMGLRSVVIEESSSSGNSNPIQRMRAALGKLVWKQNRLATHPVTTKWSEWRLLVHLHEAPLLTIEDAAIQPVMSSVASSNHKIENRNEQIVSGEPDSRESGTVLPVVSGEGATQPDSDSGKEEIAQPRLSEREKPDNGPKAALPALPTTTTEKSSANGNHPSAEAEKRIEMEIAVESAQTPLCGSKSNAELSPAGATNVKVDDQVAIDGDSKISSAPLSTGNENLNHLAIEHKNVLIKYIQSLHFTELHLRKLILQQLSVVPVHVIASAADERPGTTEATDAAFFEENALAIEWLKSGHELLENIIYRPSQSPSPMHDHLPFCRFYNIHGFTPSVASEEMETTNAEPATSDRGIGGTVIQETPGVERRIRFQAVPLDAHRQEDVLILTEAQVRAGIVAAELEKKLENRRALKSNPLATVGAQVTLYPNESSSSSTGALRGRVAGHHSVLVTNGSVDQLQHRVLILPDQGLASGTPFWVTVQDTTVEDATILCRRDNEATLFRVQQSDFHSSSQAFQDCQAVVDFLRRQPRSVPFMEPVDPVALNVPDYFIVVKNPMDISTLEKKLKSGQYSIIPPHQNPDRSPSARMLNGPFRDDAVLIFNNAMLFNPSNDWIHQAAATIKKNLLKKIEQMSSSADLKFGRSTSSTRPRAENKSVYVDEDSDVDIYDYESDRDDDDEYAGGRSSRRKRKRPSSNVGAKARAKEDYAARPLEHPIRLANLMSETSSLRGPLAKFPINMDAASFMLPPEWNCRIATIKEEPEGKKRFEEEISSLMALQKLIEDTESSVLRRSTRSHAHDDVLLGKASSQHGGFQHALNQGVFEYFVEPSFLPPLEPDHVPLTACNRIELEIVRERLHEEYFAKLHQQLGHLLVNNNESETGMRMIGTFSNGSFPPYLGRVVPVTSNDGDDQMSWEIRTPYVMTALRWVLRGLIRSGHVSQVDPFDATSNIILNHLYWIPPQLVPYEVLDVKEMQRRKRATTANEVKEQVVVEMSDYEKMRAERVARNSERLKALGLA